MFRRFGLLVSVLGIVCHPVGAWAQSVATPQMDVIPRRAEMVPDTQPTEQPQQTAPLGAQIKAIDAVLGEKIYVPADAELHVVVNYQPATSVATDRKISTLDAEIRVNRPSKKVVLILLSKQPLRWRVKPVGTSSVSMVYVNSLAPVASEVFFNDIPFPAAKSTTLSPSLESQAVEYRQFIASIQHATGRSEIDGIYAHQIAPVKGIDIHSTSAGKQKKTFPVANQNVPDLQFPAVIGGKAGYYNPAGMLMKPLPLPLVATAHDVASDNYYGISKPGIVRMDAQGQVVETFATPLDVPMFDWANVIAYDSESNELAVSDFSGHGVWYRYNLVTQQWDAYALEDVDLQSLSYDALSKHYIGVEMKSADLMLLFFDRDGKQAQKQVINAYKLPELTSMTGYQGGAVGFRVIPFDTHFVILAAAKTTLREQILDPARIYLFDRKTKEIKLTYATD